jgi:hypothetical protein
MGAPDTSSLDRREHDDGLVLAALDALPRRARILAAVRRPQIRRGQLTAHFHLREFYCKDGTRPRGGRWRTYRALCRQILEPMRDRFGPCSVHSGYRTPRHNAAVGGERGSYHVNDWHDVDDVAADVSFARGTAVEWAEYAALLRGRNRNGRGGVGRYPHRGFVHIDTRDYRADWSG